MRGGDVTQEWEAPVTAEITAFHRREALSERQVTGHALCPGQEAPCHGRNWRGFWAG